MSRTIFKKQKFLCSDHNKSWYENNKFDKVKRFSNKALFWIFSANDIMGLQKDKIKNSEL